MALPENSPPPDPLGHEDAADTNGIHVRRFAPDQAADQAGLADLAEFWKSRGETFWEFDEMMATLANPGGSGLVATGVSSHRFDGFLLATTGPYSTDLLYIYVRPECRRLGVAENLLRTLIGNLQRTPGQEELFLEVRQSNLPAQKFYRKMGMEQAGLRRAYYRDGEDALVFKLELKKAAP